MYVVIVGGGKVGASVARTLNAMGHEVTLVEQSRPRYQRLEAEFEHMVRYGDGTELFVLEEAGIGRADACIAVTGDDEDNIIICQVAREKFAVRDVVARVNDPRNQQHFDLLRVAPTVCATTSILSLIEHEVPQHGVVHLLSLPREHVDIVEVQLPEGARAVGRRVGDLRLPAGCVIATVLRDRRAEAAATDLALRAGDQVILVAAPEQAEALAGELLGSASGTGAAAVGRSDGARS